MNPPQQLLILAASACIWHGNKVLLVKRRHEPGKGLWSLPGGKLEPGETARTAAEREVLEETAVKTVLDEHLGEFEIELPSKRYVISCFSGIAITSALKAGDDAEEARWLTFSEVQLLPLAANTLTAIQLSRKLKGF